MVSAVLEGIPVIDVDTHVVEPPDLWTSRMSSRSTDIIPRVQWDEHFKDEAWFLDGKRLAPVGAPAMAGWPHYPPNHPRRWEDIDPSMWDAKARLARMDEYGIHAQILYPNVAVFNSASLQLAGDKAHTAELVRAYNDFQTDWSSEAPDRLIPMTSLPFWDLGATLKEIERCASAGHRGIVFSQDPAAFGLPGLTDRHWEPMWALAQEMGLPVNFHIATGDNSWLDSPEREYGFRAYMASTTASVFMANVRTISQLICSGICHRFPDLNFVSVESGIGWLPFTLESLDWMWKNYGVREREHPEYDLLPSEYFKRQIYGCFWFEHDSALSTLEQLGPDNILYETDFPHPASMSPGPATAAVAPQEYREDLLSDLPTETLHKILHENAARIYHLS